VEKIPRIIPHLYPKAYAEARLMDRLPKVDDAETERQVTEEVKRISDAYFEVAPRYRLDKSCNVASAVLSHFLRHPADEKMLKPVKARVISFLYLGENPRVPDAERKRLRKIAEDIARMPQGARAYFDEMRGRYLGGEDFVRAFKSHIHHAVLIPRRNSDGRGKFVYADIGYRQLAGGGGKAEPIVDVVDSAKLKEKYLLVPVSVGETRKHIDEAGLMSQGESWDVRAEIAKVPWKKERLEQMEKDDTAAYGLLVRKMDAEAEENRERTLTVQQMMSEMRDRLTRIPHA